MKYDIIMYAEKNNRLNQNLKKNLFSKILICQKVCLFLANNVHLNNIKIKHF